MRQLEDGELRYFSADELSAPPDENSALVDDDHCRVREACRRRLFNRWRSGDMSEARRTSVDEARRVGDAIGVDWSRFDLEQFCAGMNVEYEHGSHDPQTDVTGDDPILTGKIAFAHMKEYPDYYERLERMEREAEAEWSAKRG
jgi:uncharacterized protein DUF5661